MAEKSRDDADRTARLTRRREELRDYLRLVREGNKFQIVIPNDPGTSGSASEPKLMLKMRALPDKTRALAEAEINQRIKWIETKLRGLGVALE